MPQQPDEFSQYARAQDQPKDEFAAFARPAAVPTEKQAASTPPIAPVNKDIIKPVSRDVAIDPIENIKTKLNQSPTMEKIGKAVAPVEKLLSGPHGQDIMLGMGSAGTMEDVATTVMREIASMGHEVRASLPAAKAAQAFQDVHMVARDLPVDTSQATKLANLAAQEKEFGGSPPKVITEFLKRVEDPKPLTYAEARKYYSNASRLSDAEEGATNAVMRRHMTRFTKALGQSIENTVESTGQLDTYKSAMSNYKTAMRLRDTAKFIKEHAVKGAIGTGVAYGIYKGLRP
jgi:hypothetical protein